MESPTGGYVASPSEEIVLNAAQLGALTSFSFNDFNLLLPSSLPEDLRWVIRYEGTPDGTVWIDSMGLSPFAYANGIGLAITAGSISFARNDRFIFNVDNTEGIFSQFFRRRFQFQLPQSATPTIDDLLAQ